MDQRKKAELLQQLQMRFGKAAIVIVCQVTGLDARKTRELRRAIRRAGGELKVAKNTVARIAVDGTPFSPLSSFLRGPSGLVFGYGDPVSLAKTVIEFARDEGEKVQVTGAVAEGEFLDPRGVDSLAKLPGRQVLLSSLLALIQAPAASVLRVLQEPGARFVRLLAQKGRQVEKATEV